MRKNKALKVTLFEISFYCLKFHAYLQRKCNYITEKVELNFGEQ